MNDLEHNEDYDTLSDRRRSDHPADRPTLEHAHSAARLGTLWVSSALAVPSNTGARILPMTRGRVGPGC